MFRVLCSATITQRFYFEQTTRCEFVFELSDLHPTRKLFFSSPSSSFYLFLSVPFLFLFFLFYFILFFNGFRVLTEDFTRIVKSIEIVRLRIWFVPLNEGEDEQAFIRVLKKLSVKNWLLIALGFYILHIFSLINAKIIRLLTIYVSILSQINRDCN